jgi:hypothetical protein
LLEVLEKYESLRKDNQLDDFLEKQRKSLRNDPKYLAMMNFRRKLPSYQMREVIMPCM